MSCPTPNVFNLPHDKTLVEYCESFVGSYSVENIKQAKDKIKWTPFLARSKISWNLRTILRWWSRTREKMALSSGSPFLNLTTTNYIVQLQGLSSTHFFEPDGTSRYRNFLAYRVQIHFFRSRIDRHASDPSTLTKRDRSKDTSSFEPSLSDKSIRAVYQLILGWEAPFTSCH